MSIQTGPLKGTLFQLRSVRGQAAVVVRRRGPLITVLVCATAVTAALGPASAGGTSTLSAAQLLRTALRSAAAQGSVHEAGLTRYSPVRSQRLEVVTQDDVGRDSGIQTVTHPGSLASQVVVDGSAYVTGSQLALRLLYGFTAAEARKFGSKWIRVPTSNSAYARIAGDVTLSSALAQVTPVGRLTDEVVTFGGIPAIAISGTAPAGTGGGRLTLYVLRTPSYLPLAAIVTGRHGTVGSVFSHWQEHLHIRTPAGSVAINKFAQ